MTAILRRLNRKCANDVTKSTWILNNNGNATNVTIGAAGSLPLSPRLSNVISIAKYSRRSDPNNDFNFKVVKSKVRLDDESEGFVGEGGPNWELLAPRGNRFYFPHAIGPAWQSASTTINLEAPLETLVDFEGNDNNGAEGSMLKLSIGECPSLIKKSLHELFPAPEVVSSEKIALLTLRFSGDNEQGASKFVLAAREITARLRLHGYWADFMNPFSGKPFYSWSNGKSLYKVDNRFRGLNMRLTKHNHCTIITSEESELIFSGAIYTNAPSDQLKALIDEQV